MAQNFFSGNIGQNVFWFFFDFTTWPILTWKFSKFEIFFSSKFSLILSLLTALIPIFSKIVFLALRVQSVKWCISHLSDFLDQNTPHGTVLTQKPKLFSSDWSPGMVVLKNVPNQDWTPKSSTKLLGLTHSNALKDSNIRFV